MKSHSAQADSTQISNSVTDQFENVDSLEFDLQVTRTALSTVIEPLGHSPIQPAIVQPGSAPPFAHPRALSTRA